MAEQGEVLHQDGDILRRKFLGEVGL